MGATIKEEVTLETVQMGCCGVTVALPERFLEDRRRTGENFYCPNGHARCYGKGEIGKLRAELEAQKREIAIKNEALFTTRIALNNKEQEAETARKNLAKQTKRIRGGVCPCCNRFFAALSKHMQSKHPAPGVKPRQFKIAAMPAA